MDNYAQLFEGISWSLFPRLYQDAVHIVRNLDVRYLWIDSLCIIQRGDNLADWQYEAANMGDIYANALCNISALNAPNSMSSMFSSRNPESISPPIVVAKDGSRALSCVVSDEWFWQTEISNAPLNLRGWVVQERLLSPRILYFGKRHLFWECGEQDAADIYPDGIHHSPRYRSGFKKDFVSLKRDSRRIDQNYQAWWKVIQQYTACDLSYPEDKASAISAVAKRMARIMQDEYVAGLWRSRLPEQLLWRVTLPRQPPNYRAPSWSWLAVDGKVHFHLLERPDEDDILISVLHIHLNYSAVDTTGPIRGGSLKLLCKYLKRVSLA